MIVIGTSFGFSGASTSLSFGYCELDGLPSRGAATSGQVLFKFKEKDWVGKTKP